MHNILTKIFNFSEEIKFLKNKIKTFNNFSFLTASWIFLKKNRQSKKHDFIIILFNNKEIANRCMK